MSGPDGRAGPRVGGMAQGESAVGRVDPHRPVVDGRNRSSAEMRADMAELLAESADEVQEPARRVENARSGPDDTVPSAGRVVRDQPMLALAAVLGLVVLLVALIRGRQRR